MSEARFVRADDEFLLTAGATVSAYEVWQLPTGEAAYFENKDALSSGSRTDDFVTRGKVSIDKATSVVLLAGQEVYWDHSANQATYKKVNDRDFLLGVCVEDTTSTDVKVTVDLNKRQRFDIDVGRDGFLSSITGTQALQTMGLYRRGGAHKFILSATNEAQKVDVLSVDGFTPGAKWIAEFVFRVVSDGAGTVVDVSLGVANGTHATDADSIAESAFIHLDANNTNINAESDDGTTEVAATDTTTDYTEGSAVANRVHVLIDGRDLTSVKFYVNGARVLSGTTFVLSAATGPLFLLAHIEKTASTDTYELDLDCLRCWLSQQ